MASTFVFEDSARNLLCKHGRVSPGSVVDDHVEERPLFLSLIYEGRDVHDHIVRLARATDRFHLFVERMSHSVGILVAHVQRGEKARDDVSVRRSKALTRHPPLLANGRKPRPVAKNESESAILQPVEVRRREQMLGAELDVRLNAGRNLSEEAIQLGHVLFRRGAVRLALVLLLEEHAAQTLSKNLHGGLVELADISVRV